MIVSELVDGCHLRCALCWNRVRKGSFRNMSLKTVEMVLEKYGNEPRIDWHNWGEPLLHKDFIAVSELIKGTHSRVSTSLSLHVSDEKLQALKNFEHVIVSLSGMTKETYGIYHRGGNFNLVMSNLERLVKVRPVRIQWLEHDYNNGEQAECASMCQKLGIEFCSKGLNCEVENQVSGFFSDMVKKYRANRKECYLLDDIVIGANGEYMLCCASHNVEIGLNISDNVSKKDIIRAKFKTDLCRECRSRELWRLY